MPRTVPGRKSVVGRHIPWVETGSRRPCSFGGNSASGITPSRIAVLVIAAFNLPDFSRTNPGGWPAFMHVKSQAASFATSSLLCLEL